MRVAIVAGPDAGHAFPAFALARRLTDADVDATVFTGSGRMRQATARGIAVAELPGLDPVSFDDDTDAGAKLGLRAARMAVALAPRLALGDFDVVVSDVITVAGGWAAELVGLPWVELSPHPLYRPSRGLPPIGSGLAPGTGGTGRLRDTAMRAATSMSIRKGLRQRKAARRQISLTGDGEPAARLVATLPGLEVRRPDWPPNTHLIGPLLWEPTDTLFTRPPGSAPLVVVAPSTAATGAPGMLTHTLRGLRPDVLGFPVRVVISSLSATGDLDAAAFGSSLVSGLGRQDELLSDASVVVCGAGHGLLAKSLLAGVPVVTVPGGGDQWELANRVCRAGAGVLVRPVDAAILARAVRTVLADPAYGDAARALAASVGDVVDPVALLRRVATGNGGP